MSSEEYEKKTLDRISDAFIDALVWVIDRVRKGWSEKNRSRISEWKLMGYALNRSPPGVIGLILAIAFIVLGIVGPYLAPYKYYYFPTLETTKAWLAPPGSTIQLSHNKSIYYPLGADNYGRDLLSLLLQGARTSLVITIVTILFGVPLGIILGLISGYYGGKVDELIMRITDIFLAFPALILAIAFAAVLPDRIDAILNSNPWLTSFFLQVFALAPQHSNLLSRPLSVIFALILVWWPGYARIVRGATLSARENLYVEAARAIGLSDTTIMFRHILPNIIGNIIVLVTLDFGGVVLTEAGLSFLGLGAVPPIADWGRIVYDGAQYFPEKWWLVMFPGLVVIMASLGWNLLGDSLRDVLDPKTRRSIEFKIKKKKG